MARTLSVKGEDGHELHCVCVTPSILCVQTELDHLIWIMSDMKKTRPGGDGCLPFLFTSHVLPLLAVMVEPRNLWNAFGIKRRGHPQFGRSVDCSRARELLSLTPANCLLGLNWQFPGFEGGYSLLHRACDPALTGLEESVAIALAQRSDFSAVNAKRFGITALHFMASRGWADACRHLIQRQDFSESLSWVYCAIESSNGVFFHPGDTVLDVARGQSHMHVVQAVKDTLAAKNSAWLEQHGVRHF